MTSLRNCVKRLWGHTQVTTLKYFIHKTLTLIDIKFPNFLIEVKEDKKKLRFVQKSFVSLATFFWFVLSWLSYLDML